MIIAITGYGKPNSLGAHIGRALKGQDPSIKIVAIINPNLHNKDVYQGFDYILPCNLENQYELKFIAQACEKIGVNGLVNCAGTNHMDWIKNITHEQYQRVMTVNLEAPIFLTKHFNEFMKDGFVLNICSMGARKAFRTSMPYNVSKAGLVMATKQMARELYPETGNVIFGISPNQISGTGMTVENDEVIKEVRGWTTEQATNYRMTGALVKEDTTPEQIAAFIAFMLARRSRYIQFCGQELQYGD